MRLFKKSRRVYVKAFVINKKPVYIVLFALVLTICVMYFLSSLLKPFVLELAKNEAEVVSTKCVNESVLTVLKNEDFDYSDIITIHKDGNGRVTSLSGDAVKMNILKSLISGEILNNISSFDEMYVSVPIYHIFGNSLFTSSSPRLKIEVLPLKNIDVDFESIFESSGVNQTKHDVYINTKLNYTVLTPAGKAKGSVSTSVLVAQTVIIGDVPNSYINVQSEEGELKSDILDLAP